MSAIAFKNLSKDYGSLVALNDVSLEIEESEFFGMLGPNGAGKTTFISILAGLCRPTAGSVEVMGHMMFKWIFVQRDACWALVLKSLYLTRSLL